MQREKVTHIQYNVPAELQQWMTMNQYYTVVVACSQYLTVIKQHSGEGSFAQRWAKPTTTREAHPSGHKDERICKSQAQS